MTTNATSMAQLIAHWRERATLLSSIAASFREMGGEEYAQVALAIRREVLRCADDLAALQALQTPDLWLKGYEAGLRKGQALDVDGGTPKPSEAAEPSKP